MALIDLDLDKAAAVFAAAVGKIIDSSEARLQVAVQQSLKDAAAEVLPVLQQEMALWRAAAQAEMAAWRTVFETELARMRQYQFRAQFVETPQG